MKSLTKKSAEPARQYSAKPKTELAYVRSVYIQLKKKGIAVAWEAAFFGRSIDLAFEFESHLFAIEFKLKDWRRAIHQANHHKLGADYVYICIPNRQPSKVIIRAAKLAKVGVLTLNNDSDWPFDIVHSSPRSKQIWPAAKEKIRNQLKAA
jgi:hypothetical protein